MLNNEGVSERISQSYKGSRGNDKITQKKLSKYQKEFINSKKYCQQESFNSI